MENNPSLIRLAGPWAFPDVPMTHNLERRWVHYAFLSLDNQMSMVGNITWAGPDPEMPDTSPQVSSILLMHKQGEGWRSSQYNALVQSPLWSSFSTKDPSTYSLPNRFEMAAVENSPAVRLDLQRTSRPSANQSATFAGNQHFRWQSETGVKARGVWQFDDQVAKDIQAIGYHERVRGCWDWPDIGGWVHGFASDPAGEEPDAPPETAVVFTLLFPTDSPDSAKASIIVWRRGRMWRHFPRRNVSVIAYGELDPNLVVQVPELANLLDVPPMPTIPSRLILNGQLGEDRILIDFRAETAARLIVPNETGIEPYRIYETLGLCRVTATISGTRIAYETRGLVEFTGGAGDL
jgi:hypothetical protein